MIYLQSLSEALLNTEDTANTGTEVPTFEIKVLSENKEEKSFKYEDLNTFFSEEIKSLKEGDVITFPAIDSTINVIENFNEVKESLEKGEFDLSKSTEEEVSESITCTVESIGAHKEKFMSICSITESEDKKKYFVLYEQ